jgi:hypothetical protein
MAILKPRTRLVYFRISESEYEQILRLCEQTGARSVSDFARSAIRRLTEPKTDEQLLQTKNALEELLVELKSSVRQLTALESAQSFSEELTTAKQGAGPVGS